VFLGAAYKLLPNLSVGADVHYNFGKIETSGLVFVTDIPVGTRQLNRATLSGVDYSVGTCTKPKSTN
jgi:hypothetical protein